MCGSARPPRLPLESARSLPAESSEVKMVAQCPGPGRPWGASVAPLPFSFGSWLSRGRPLPRPTRLVGNSWARVRLAQTSELAMLALIPRHVFTGVLGGWKEGDLAELFVLSLLSGGSRAGGASSAAGPGSWKCPQSLRGCWQGRLRTYRQASWSARGWLGSQALNTDT